MGGTTASVSTWADGTIVFTVPASLRDDTTYTVSVRTSGGGASAPYRLRAARGLVPGRCNARG